jgi:hypothetical protein
MKMHLKRATLMPEEMEIVSIDLTTAYGFLAVE